MKSIIRGSKHVPVWGAVFGGAVMGWDLTPVLLSWALKSAVDTGVPGSFLGTPCRQARWGRWGRVLVPCGTQTCPGQGECWACTRGSSTVAGWGGAGSAVATLVQVAV